MAKTLLIGPLPPPLNGQSKCFSILAQNLSDVSTVDRNVSGYGLIAKTFKYGKCLTKSVMCALFSPTEAVYISISRNLFGMSFDALIIVLFRLRRKRVILHLHGSDFLLKNYQKLIFSRTHSLCSTFVTLSVPMKKRIQNLLNCDVKLLTNPVEDRIFESPGTEFSSCINVVFLSNVMESKGIFDFIAIARLLDDRQDYHFHIIGPSMSDHLCTSEEISNKITAATNELSNLSYHHGVYGSDLIELLGTMHILLFPSYYPIEALPLSVLECAAMGIYPIVNDHNDMNVFIELLAHVTVTDTGNHDHVRELIVSFTKEKLMTYGAANREKCLAYSAEGHVQAMKTMIEGG